MLRLLIESGSTKSDVVIYKNSIVVKAFAKAGINPTTMSEDHIAKIVFDIKSECTEEIGHIIFYGSGVKFENKEILQRLIHLAFPNASIETYSDMLAAIRASSNGLPSIVCILGTGSNSCLSNGHEITHQKISLGYLLGDEGSANDLGKKLLISYYYGYLKEEIRQELEQQFPELKSNFISDLYLNENKAERLGQFGKFVIEHKSQSELHDIILLCLNNFYNRRLSYYSDHIDLPIYFIGTIAHHLQTEICQVIQPYGFTNIHFSKKPIEDLMRYHLQHERN